MTLELLYKHITFVIDSVSSVVRPLGPLLEKYIRFFAKNYEHDLRSLKTPEEVIKRIDNTEFKVLPTKVFPIEIEGAEKAYGEIPNESIIEDLREKGIEYLAPARLLFLYSRSIVNGITASLRHSDNKINGFYLPVFLIF